MRFPLQGTVLLETPYISLDDRFAAQITHSSFAPGGAMEDKPAGRCPPIVRLLSCQGSFHFSVCGLKIVKPSW